MNNVQANSRNETFIKCINCGSKNSFKKSVIECPSNLEADLVQILLVCPDCGHEKHCFFMSKKLYLARGLSENTIKALSMVQTQENLDRVKDVKEKYKNLFDEEQEKFRELLEKENERTA